MSRNARRPPFWFLLFFYIFWWQGIRSGQYYIMMAEKRRRKQTFVNLRCENDDWMNDETKFGQRMLEKMGWSSGKGLGAKENGIVERVVARYKNDQKGLGYKVTDQSTKTIDDFDNLLASLSQSGSSSEEKLHSGVSLEVKSKKSQSRIHYFKFTRGKDVAVYSKKDIADIFGKKINKAPLQTEETEQLKSNMEQVAEICNKVFTEKGSMDDYFKEKLTALQSRRKSSRNFENEEHTEYSFQGFSQIDHDTKSNNERKVKTDLIDEVTQNDEVPKKKKKKSKKLKPKNIV